MSVAERVDPAFGGALRFNLIATPVPTSYDGTLPPDSEHKAPADVKSLFGTYYHAVAAHLLKGVSIAEYAEWWHDRYGDSPTIVQSWVHATEDAVPAIQELLTPDEGFEAGPVLTEIPYYVGSTALSSAEDIREKVIVEQRGGDGEPGPLERLLTNNPAFMLPYLPTKDFVKLMKRMPKGFPYTRKQLEEHLENMRAFQLTKNKKVLFVPTSRIDLMSFEYAEDDVHARQACSAISEVFKAGVGFNAQRLANLKVPYTVDEGTPEAVTFMAPGLEALYEGLCFVQEGRVRIKAVDHKTISRLDDGLGNEPVDVIFSEEHMLSNDPEYLTAQNRMLSYYRCIARSLYSIRSWLRFAIQQYDSMPGHREDLHLDLDQIMDSIIGSVFIADCDLRDPRSRPDEDNGNRLEYLTEPPIETVGTPRQITVIERQIDRELVKRYWELWERHVHIMSLMGRFAIKKAAQEPQKEIAG